MRSLLPREFLGVDPLRYGSAEWGMHRRRLEESGTESDSEAVVAAAAAEREGPLPSTGPVLLLRPLLQQGGLGYGVVLQLVAQYRILTRHHTRVW